MPLNMRWLGTACFEIRLPDDQTVIIDPYVDDSVSAPVRSEAFHACDYILITHGHYDHVLDVGKLADRFSPEIFCNDVTADSLINVQGVDAGLIHRIHPGERIERKGVEVDVLKGVHVDFSKEYRRLTGRDLPAHAQPVTTVTEGLKVMLGTDQVPDRFEEWMATYPGGEQLNYGIEPAGGKRVYMAGTYPQPDIIEVAGTAQADITLLQVLPGNTVHGMEEQIARLAIASGCRIAIPQHHDPLFRGSVKTDLSELRRVLASNSDIEFQELVPGNWTVFE
ncbi:MAG: MBL fold metallo-hydrolase [Deltaproteobacteria bacterium]